MAAFVKICGIKSPGDARAGAEAGADYLGFHVALKGGRSPLSKEEAAALIAALPAGVRGVVVTSAADADELIDIARATGAAALQLYGEASPGAITQVKKALPSVAVWKVLSVSDESSVAKAHEYEKTADAIALDTLGGGSGKTHDWSVSKKIVESATVPVVLAGGLNPDNVAEAINTVRPYAVDVNSGVSNPDGSKDIEKVKAFIIAAKSA